MAQRSRKRRPASAPRGYARSRERDEKVRAGLEPLAPGERPRSITVAAIVAGVAAVANIAAAPLADDREGAEWRMAILQSVVLAAAALGMWRRRYWAVLGFEALLGIAILIAFLGLLTASNAAAVLFCVGIIALCSPLFWFLVRAMARLQMPERASRVTGR